MICEAWIHAWSDKLMSHLVHLYKLRSRMFLVEHTQHKNIVAFISQCLLCAESNLPTFFSADTSLPQRTDCGWTSVPAYLIRFLISASQKL